MSLNPEPGRRTRIKASSDMIMALPLNLIQRILERLPLRDAARTSVLSKDWRYIWLSLSQVTFDLKFSEAIQKQENAILDFQWRYSDTVSKILLRHRGPIHKFVLNIPSQLPESTNVDCWIEFVCQHGVKDFYVTDQRLTKLKPPSCLFSCVWLTHLTLDCGSLFLPSTFRGFPRLVYLKLCTSEVDSKKLETLIHNCPQLEKLGLVLSKAIHSLTIQSSKLQHLYVIGVNYTVTLKETEKIKTVGLGIQGGDMVDMLRHMPRLQVFLLSNFRECKLKLPKSLAMRLERLHMVILSMSLTCQYNISLLLCLFNSCPRLSTLEITALTCKSCVENLPEFDMSCSLKSLKWVKFLRFSGSSSELHLVKFLLAQAPALQLMTIVFDASVMKVYDAKFNLAMAVTRFRRASANAEILLQNDCTVLGNQP